MMTERTNSGNSEVGICDDYERTNSGKRRLEYVMIMKGPTQVREGWNM